MGRGYNPRFPDNRLIRELWVKGWDVKQIAKHYGMHERTVHRRLKEIDLADAHWDAYQEQLAYRPEYV
jgi:uncharacterized protein YjcR